MCVILCDVPVIKYIVPACCLYQELPYFLRDVCGFNFLYQLIRLAAIQHIRYFRALSCNLILRYFHFQSVLIVLHLLSQFILSNGKSELAHINVYDSLHFFSQ